MQDRYVGDFGDFAKYSLLNSLAFGKKLGIAWYLYPDESHNDDGKHVSYLQEPDKWRDRDAHVFDTLKMLVGRGERNISALENSGCLNATAYASQLLKSENSSYQQRSEWRVRWFNLVLESLCQCDIVFADPDNGLWRDPKYKSGNIKMWKSLPVSEALALAYGRTAIIYHHNSRFPGGHAAEIQSWMSEFGDCFAIRVRNYSARTFFVINPTDEIHHRAKDWCRRFGEKVELVARTS